MNDLIFKGRVDGLEVAFSIVTLTAAVNEAVLLHDCDPVAAHLLGRAMAGGLLAAALLPPEHRLNIYWRYSGTLRTLVVDAGADGTVRALIAPPHLGAVATEEELYGDTGELQAIQMDSAGKILHSATTPIALHDVVDDLAYHYSISDQVETGIAAVIGFQAEATHPVQLARGCMIQALPGADLEQFDRIRQRMGESAFRAQLAQLEMEPPALIQSLVESEAEQAAIHLDGGVEPRFKCTCDHEKMGAVLRSIPIPERMEIVQAGQPLSVRCQFCNKRYEMTMDECIKAWNTKDKSTGEEDGEKL